MIWSHFVELPYTRQCTTISVSHSWLHCVNDIIYLNDYLPVYRKTLAVEGLAKVGSAVVVVAAATAAASEDDCCSCGYCYSDCCQPISPVRHRLIKTFDPACKGFWILGRS